jgi:hypothetical protein
LHPKWYARLEGEVNVYRLIGTCLVLALVLAGCAPTTPSGAAKNSAKAASAGEETSIGVSVSQDDPDLPHADSAGNTPEEVLLAYVRATNRQDWKTRWALIAPPKESYDLHAKAWDKDPIPYDDFEAHETRIVQSNQALVRVTYSTIGFSAMEGLTDEERRRLVVVREPGEWWVLEKSDTDDAIWLVTFKGPHD